MASPVTITGGTGLQAQQGSELDTYLQKKGSPLAGHGYDFAQAGKQYGIDPLLLVAITGAETNFGKYGPSQAIHNPFGLGPNISYGSYTDAIYAAARSIAGYKVRGSGIVGAKDITAIQPHWAPIGAKNDPTGLNKNWAGNVLGYYNEIQNSFAGNAVGPIGNVILAPVHAVQSIASGFGSVLDVLKAVFSIRGAYFLGGAVSGILGIIVLAKSLQGEAIKSLEE